MPNLSRFHSLHYRLSKFLLVISSAFLFSFIGKSQPLNGVYTIGGISPNYPTFASAVTYLNANGVSGPVVFNIRTGTYIEQIKIIQYSGSSLINTVTFQSETGNPSDVILAHQHANSSTNSNYTIFLDGADNINFKNLSIKAIQPANPTSTDYNRVVYITNSADGVTFENNKILSWFTNDSSGEYNDCVFIGADASSMDNDDINFTGNLIYGGHSGITFKGSGGSGVFNTENLTLKQNVFYRQYGYGIKVSISKNLKLIGNEIYNHFYNPSMIGISINQNSDTLLIEKNYVRLSGTDCCIFISSVTNGQSNYKYISNNILLNGSLLGSGNPTGIKCGNDNDNLNIVYNAIHLFSSVNGHNIQSSLNDSLTVLNNLLSNTGGGYCYYVPSTAQTYFSSDYNNLYKPVSSIAQINGIVCNNLIDITNQLNTDQNSVNIDPFFISDTNLISYNPATYNSGIAINHIINDYFNTVRSLTSPDIGIYEGSLPSTNIGIVNSNLMDYTICPNDSTDVYVSLKNFGTQILNSAELYCGTSDSVYLQYNWSGNLSGNQTLDSIFLGRLYFTTSMETINLKCWSSNPNFQTDSMPLNDTLDVFPITAMNGVYYVGGNPTDDFPNLASAINALITYGVCGPVTINIQPGTFVEQVSIPFIQGSSFTNSITIKSTLLDSSTVTIQKTNTSSANNYIIKLDGAENIHIKHLKIYPTGTTYQIGLLITNGAKNNVISNNQFVGTYASPTNERCLLYFLTQNGIPITNNEVSFNRFVNGAYQLRVYGNQNIVYTNNNVIQNIFTGTAGVSIDYIWHDDFTISGNLFTGSRAWGGLRLINTNNYSVLKNNINIDGLSIIGMNLAICSGTSLSPVKIQNNFILAHSTNSSNALRLEDCSFLDIINNSIAVVDNDNAVIFSTQGNSNVNLKNNIIYSNDASLLIRSLATLTSSQINSDYNAFFTTNSDHFTSGSNIYTFSQWRSVNSFDMNSIFTDPQFFSNSDLHVNNAYLLKHTGTSIYNIVDDIDNEARPYPNPDIGADEFLIDSMTYHDVELVSISSIDTMSCSIPDSLIIRIVNHSIMPITSVEAKFELFNISKNYTFYNVNINPGDTISLSLGSFNFNPNTYYEMRFTIDQPNAETDNHFNDNTKNISFYYLDNLEIFQYQDSQCNSDTELYIKSFPLTSILWNTGATQNNIIVSSPGTYSVTITDEKGCVLTDTITVN